MLHSFENLPLIICRIISFFPSLAKKPSTAGRLPWPREAREGHREVSGLRFSSVLFPAWAVEGSSGLAREQSFPWSGWENARPLNS